jgi:hypothetical protein
MSVVALTRPKSATIPLKAVTNCTIVSVNAVWSMPLVEKRQGIEPHFARRFFIQRGKRIQFLAQQIHDPLGKTQLPVTLLHIAIRQTVAFERSQELLLVQAKHRRNLGGGHAIFTAQRKCASPAHGSGKIDYHGFSLEEDRN